MNKTILLAMLAGLMGGMLTRYISPVPVFAQAQVQEPAQPATPQPAPSVNDVRARRFQIVDQSDHVMGTFSAERDIAGLTRIVLWDSRGKEIWSAPAQTRIVR